ncbi:MAG TPA: GntR family transcriptional regulator [Chloroflexota bacterium]|nr:GntR family transcriptional regulator [Chloroflexota bacterium]
MTAGQTFRLETYRTLQELVYQSLREAILDGRLVPGQRLVAGNLAAELGVSRMPVREALSRLQQDGFVKATPHREVVVAGFSERDVVEIYDIRSVLEAHAAGLCAVHATPGELEQLRELVGGMQQALEDGDLERVRRLDNDFHHTLFNTCGSGQLAQLLTQLWDQCLYYRSLAVSLNRNPARSLEHHQQIVAALERHDHQNAEKWIHTHTQVARDTLLDHLRARRKSQEKDREA